MRKKVSALLLSGCMLFTAGGQLKAETLIIEGKQVQYNLPPISLYVNNEPVNTAAMNPVQINGRVLVPLREAFEAMGAVVQWNGIDKTASVKYKSITVILAVSQKQALVNGMTAALDVPAQMINNKVMIPIRFVSEALGMNVSWDAENRGVWISEPATSQMPVQTTGQSYTGSGNSHQLTVPAMSCDKTSISSVTVTESAGKATAVISAVSPISSADISLMTGKVVIDVKNSLSLLAAAITPAENTYVKSIRTSQFTADTTRIVLDLKSGAVVNASLSADRKELKIGLGSQNLEGMKVTSSGSKDYIFFKGLSSSQLALTENPVTHQIQFVIPNMKIKNNIQWEKIDSNMISNLKVTQSGSDLVGTAVLKKAAKASVETNDSGLNIVLQEQASQGTATNNGGSNSSSSGTSSSGSSASSEGNGQTGELMTSGLAYVAGAKTVIDLNNISGLTADSITVTDNYRSRQLIFDLGKDFSHVLKSETKVINDGYVKSIEVATSGTTKITVNTASVYAYNINAASGSVRLQLVKPGEKYDKVVVVDIGHGGSDSGAVANNLKEKEVNYKQGMALYRLLEADKNIKVYMTRETDTYPTLQFRSTLANDIQADLFISIHNNSASAGIAGTETLYFPSTSDLRGKQIAQLIQNSIVRNCNMTDRGIKARSDLYVLRTTDMPAVLIETGFLTNAAEAAKISSPAYISTWAQAVYEAVVQGLKLI